MTIGQYLLLAAILYPATGYLCYLFIYKPGKRKINERYSVQSKDLESDTESVRGGLYRVEGRQVLVIPTECELNVSGVKIKRVAGALVIYPTDKAWAEYSEIFAAYRDHSARADMHNERLK